MTVSILLARGLVQLVEKSGVAGAHLLERAGLAPARLGEAEGRLDLEEYEALHAVALELTGDAALGLHLGQAASVETYGLAAHLIGHARSLREALEGLIKFYRLISDRPACRLVETEHTASVVFDSFQGRDAFRRFRAESTMTGFHRMVRYFARGRLPDRVAFEYAEPSYRGEYALVFEGVERFAQPFTGIVLARSLLDARQSNHDPELQAALHAQAERRVARLAGTITYAERLRERILDGVPEGRHDMPGLARALGVSTRTLRRRLQEEGASYRDVVDGALLTLAKQLLADARRPIKDVAGTLGFSDNAAFARAFRRWAGMTPRQFREENGPPRANGPGSVRPPAARDSAPPPGGGAAT